jgi:hypothetical protein
VYTTEVKSTAGNCPLLPFDDDFQTAAFSNKANNIEAEKPVIGTFRKV